MLAGVLLLAATCSTVWAEELTREQLNDAITQVSIELFKAVTAGNVKNHVLSPVSVNILLALMEHGSNGESSRQLQTALRLGRSDLLIGYRRLSEALQRDGSEDLQLEVANRVFVSETFPLREEFLQVARRDFYSGVQNVSFVAGNASEEINAWVAETTHGKIPAIVDKDLSPATVMVLANAMFFKSPWLNKFKKSYTQEGTFAVDDKKNVTVPFMFQEDTFLFGSNEDLKVKWIELPFKDGNHSLLVVLPNEQFGLSDVIANMTSSHVASMLQDSSWKGVRLHLPRFSINSKTELIPALKQLGIKDVFEAGRSDLSGISYSKEPLSVSNVLQKATMEIDEDGGVASAATVVEFVVLSSMTLLDPEEFRVDRPFLAMIVDKNENVPLFIATIADPLVG